MLYQKCEIKLCDIWANWFKKIDVRIRNWKGEEERVTGNFSLNSSILDYFSQEASKFHDIFQFFYASFEDHFKNTWLFQVPYTQSWEREPLFVIGYTFYTHFIRSSGIKLYDSISITIINRKKCLHRQDCPLSF